MEEMLKPSRHVAILIVFAVPGAWALGLAACSSDTAAVNSPATAPESDGGTPSCACDVDTLAGKVERVACGTSLCIDQITQSCSESRELSPGASCKSSPTKDAGAAKDTGASSDAVQIRVLAFLYRLTARACTQALTRAAQGNRPGSFLSWQQPMRAQPL
jgi:hypothetical protein